ncbi:hypothetical protein TcCL_ESM05007 [Trypanosoma cruzi]|nr:hypothetical protein TcCL_ESM05007 [Trypanosoma cruzi]
MAVIPKAGQVFHGEDGTFSIVLPDTCDPNNEPTQEELLDYANWLGIDAEKEPHLLWIARQGLRTPLPAEWKACRTGEGDVYYFNFLTGENSWEHPMDDVFKRKVEEERAKLVDGEGGSSKTRKKSKSSSTAGGKGDRGVEKRRLEKGAAGYVTSPERSGERGKTECCYVTNIIDVHIAHDERAAGNCSAIWSIGCPRNSGGNAASYPGRERVVEAIEFWRPLVYAVWFWWYQHEYE